MDSGGQEEVGGAGSWGAWRSGDRLGLRLLSLKGPFWVLKGPRVTHGGPVCAHSGLRKRKHLPFSLHGDGASHSV